MLSRVSSNPTDGGPTDAPKWMSRRRGSGICIPECSRAALIRWIDYPELPLKTSTCETVKCGRSSLVVRAEIPCGPRRLPIAYKRFRRRSLWKVVSGVVKPTRAARAWRCGQKLLEQGIATPRPVFAIAPRGLVRGIDSYLATEWVEGRSLAVLLHNATQSGSLNSLWTVFRSVARLVGLMHRGGFSHRDLKPGNIMISHDSAAALLVDLDGVSRRRLTRRLRLKNLSRLFLGVDLTEPAAEAFVQHYLLAAGDTGWQAPDCLQQLSAVTRQRSLSRAASRAAA